MTRSERFTLLTTFTFGVLGMVGIGVLATRFVDHPRPLPPLELPYFMPPALPHFEPPKADVPRSAPHRASRGRAPFVAAPLVAAPRVDSNCTDPLCGVKLGR